MSVKHSIGDISCLTTSARHCVSGIYCSGGINVFAHQRLTAVSQRAEDLRTILASRALMNCGDKPFSVVLSVVSNPHNQR